MRILVTGGAGYVGSHACKALAATGHEPIVYDNLVNGHRRFVRWGPFEEGDILDAQRLDAVMATHKPDAVMHFAAHAYVGESVTDPGKYYRNNVAGTLTVLEAMRDHNIKKMVFSSTCATFGIPEQSPIDEDAPQRPINPYGASKLMIERMLADFHAAHGLGFASLRYFNAAGADPDGEIGENHDPETHLIPLVLQTASEKQPYITIFGDDYPTLDGTCIRDYIHVTDLADAHVLALAYLADGGPSLAFNLGTGQGHSVRQVIDAAKAVTGRAIPEVIAPRRSGDPPELVASPGRVRRILGWKPQYSALEGMISTAWNWQCKSNSSE